MFKDHTALAKLVPPRFRAQIVCSRALRPLAFLHSMRRPSGFLMTLLAIACT